MNSQKAKRQQRDPAEQEEHQKPEQTENDGFMNIPEGIDEEIAFQLGKKEGCDDMGLKEAFRKVGQVIEETKMKIGMKKYKKGGIQVEEKDQKPEMVIPINDIPLPEEKRETEDAEIRKIEDLPAYEDRKFYIAAKMQVEPEEVEK